MSTIAARRRGWPSRQPYGAVFDRARRDLFAAFVEGTRCPYADCPYPGRRMYSWQGLDAGHVVPRMLGGGIGEPVLRVEHRKCNRRHGARMGNAARQRRTQVAAMKARASRAVREAQRKEKWG